MKQRILIGLAILIVASMAGGAMTWRHYETFLARELPVIDDGQVFEVEPGDSVRSVIRRLQSLGAVTPDYGWQILTRLEPVTIQVGEYRLTAGMTPMDLLAMMASGNVIQYRFTIVEGWNYQQLYTALINDDVLLSNPEKISAAQVMFSLNVDQHNPEGWFLPETYAYVRGDSALDLLSRAYTDMSVSLEEAWQSRQTGLPLQSPYDLLTLASIIEKESANVAERPDIAGVFVRRLQQGWRLGTDPTVIYGMGDDYNGDIRSRDLKNDTPYNTYIHKGLPPTPIAMPGRNALMASANPASGTSMFFVADGTGGHTFSDTLEAHNKAVQAMLKRQRQTD